MELVTFVVSASELYQPFCNFLPRSAVAGVSFGVGIGVGVCVVIHSPVEDFSMKSLSVELQLRNLSRCPLVRALLFDLKLLLMTRGSLRLASDMGQKQLI